MGRACMMLLLITLLGIGSTVGQRGSAPVCPVAACNHSLTGEAYQTADPSLNNYLFGANMVSDWPSSDSSCAATPEDGRRYIASFDGASVIDEWHPPRPGVYKFEFVATDECGSNVPRTASREVEASCPTPPTIESLSGGDKMSDGKVLVGSMVKFQAGTIEPYKLLGEQAVGSYSWYWIKKPDNEPGLLSGEEPLATRDSSWKPCKDDKTCLSDQLTYTTKTLSTPGEYTLEFQLSDGCSTSVKRICFEVTCNCAPTANARVETSSHPARGSCVDKDVPANIAALDGSGSFDFDLMSGEDKTLSYEWSMVSWEPAPDLAFKSLEGARPHGELASLFPASRSSAPSPLDLTGIWLAGALRASTGRTPGYQTLFECKDLAYNDAQKSIDDAQKTVDTLTAEIAGLQSCETEKLLASKPTLTCYTEDTAAAQKCALTEQLIAKRIDLGAAVAKVQQAVLARDKLVCKTKTYTFKRLPAASTTSQTCSQDITLRQAFAPDVQGGQPGLPVPVPDEHFGMQLDQTKSNKNRLAREDTVTSSCLATKTVTPSTSFEREVSARNCTTSAPSCEEELVFCQIKISNAGTAKATVTAHMDKTLSPAESVLNKQYGQCPSYNRCRGRFVFRLNVQDSLGCTSSTDEVTLTVRCSRPPVAIAGKKTVVRYGTNPGQEKFPQVTLDGRSSFDRYGVSDLTYVWSFASYPDDFGNKCGTKPAPLGGALQQVVQVAGVAGSQCVPTPYNSIAANDLREGNSAYFTPTSPGTYVAQLSVFDGCSVVTDTVEVAAVCPDLSVVVELDSYSSDFTAGKVSVKATCTPSGGDDWWLSGVNDAKLKYSWAVSWDGDTARLIPTMSDASARYGANGAKALPATREATIDLMTFGRYTITCTVSDGCSSVSASKLHTVTCGTTMPILGSDLRASKTNPILLEDGVPRGYSVVTLTSSVANRAARNIDGDIKYTWSPSVPADFGAVVNPPKTKNDDSNVRFDMSIRQGISPAGGNLPFQAQHLQLNHSLFVQVYAFDLCQRNPTPRAITLDYKCDEVHNIPNADLANRVITWSTDTNNPAAIGFEGNEIKATDWTSRSYPQRVVRKWQRKRGNAAYTEIKNGGAAVLQIGNTFVDNALRKGEMSIPPKTSARNPINNVYTVRLEVTDGCSTQSREIVITYDCNSWPTAALTLKDQAAKDGLPSECDTASANSGVCVVHWNSYDLIKVGNGYSAHGRFPQIFADITGSQNADKGQLLKFDLSAGMVAGAVDAAKISNIRDNRGAAVKLQEAWRPDGGLSTTSVQYNMDVTAYHSDKIDSPCKSAPVTRTVQTKCNKLEVDNIPREQIKWAQTRFKLACADLRNIRYVTDDVNQTEANLDSIKYTWRMKSAPANSMFKSGTDPNFYPGRGEKNDIRCREVSLKPAARSYSKDEKVTMTLMLGGHCPANGTYVQDLGYDNINGPYRNLENPAPAVNPDPKTGCAIAQDSKVMCVDNPWTTIGNAIGKRNYWELLRNGGAVVRAQFVSYNNLGEKKLSAAINVIPPPGRPPIIDGKLHFTLDAPKAQFDANSYASQASVRVQVVTDPTKDYPDLCDKDMEEGDKTKGGCLDAFYVNFTYTTESAPKPQCSETNSVLYCSVHRKKVSESTEVVLANHHYNKPYTCFRPDVAGGYELDLEMDDGCFVTKRSISFVSQCPEAILSMKSKVKVQMLRGQAATSSSTNVAFDGQTFTRVELDGRAIEQEAVNNGNDIHFQWSLASCPMGYDATKGKDANAAAKNTQITNANGAKASFIPREPGTYTIQLSVDDHCNPPQTETFTVHVNCTIPFSSPVLTVKKGSSGESQKWPVQEFDRNRNARVVWPLFDKDQPLAGKCKTSTGSHRSTNMLKALGGKKIDAPEDKNANGEAANRIVVDGKEQTVSYGNKIGGVGCWSGEKFRFEASMSATCSKTKTRWLITERRCARSERPPDVSTADAQNNECASINYKCEWALTALPCNFKWAAIGGDPRPESCEDAKGKNCVAIGAGAAPTEDAPIKISPTESCQNAVIHFKCRHAGTYSLKFTVKDDCSTSDTQTTVSCQCATTPTVRATQTLYQSLYTCTKDTSKFQPVSVSVIVDDVDGFALQRCPSPAAPAAPAANTAVCPTQCPSASVCPQCPQCPMCPPCADPRSPGRSGSLSVTRDPAFIAASAQRRNRVFVGSSEEETEISYGPVMGVILPMSAVMVFSIAANLLLFSKISERRNRKSKLSQV